MTVEDRYGEGHSEAGVVIFPTCWTRYHPAAPLAPAEGVDAFLNTNRGVV